MGQQRYFAAQTEQAPERTRLSALEELFDPPTFERLAAQEVSEGWRCLDVGAGGGSVVRWLADRVGQSGRVVAVDLDVRFLEKIDLPNVEVRRCDFLSDDIEVESFDLVHCRHLLAHLPGRLEEAVRRMASALKPGGVLLAEEADSTIMTAVHKEHELGPPFDRVAEALVAFARDEGLWEPATGSLLPKVFSAVGLVDVGQSGWSWVERGGDNATTRFFGSSGELVGQLLLDKGYVSKADWQARSRAYADPTFWFRSLLMMQVWGRSP